MIPSALVQLGAAFLFLLPVVIILLWRSGQSDFVAGMVAWIPAAVALDLLGCLVLARLFPLDLVLLASRLLYLIGLVQMVRLRRRRAHRASWPPAKQVAIILAAGMAGLLLSMSISRPSSIWDRQFHVPLVSMLRDQRVPFLTVFQPRTVLHFHFAGDVFAAALQVLSFGRLHASLALALAHDLIFALAGVGLAAWLTTLSGVPRPWIVIGVLALFSGGPFALQRVGLGSTTMGYSYLNILTLSYRPSISIAMLMLLGGFGTLSLRMSRRSDTSDRLLIALFACMALLAISDEPSAALLGVAIFAVWLIQPDILHRSRTKGLLILAGLVLAILIPNFLFEAALVPGGPAQRLRLVAPRSPGYAFPPLALASSAGRYALLMDIGPFLLIFAAFLAAAFRERSRVRWGRTVALGAILLTATLAMCTVDLNGMNVESHRFMTSCMVIFPVAALVLLAELACGRWERVLLIGALVASASSTLHWYQAGFGDPDDWFTNNVDCRSSAGARLFERARPTYVPKTSLYAFAGCRPVFVAGGDNDAWAGILSNGYALAGKAAFEALHRKFVSNTEALRVACPVSGWQSDVACAYAMTKTTCQPAGTQFRTCDLSKDDRDKILATQW